MEFKIADIKIIDYSHPKIGRNKAKKTMNQLLSPGQKKLLGVTLSALCASVLLIMLYALFLLIHRFFQTFSMVLWPVIVALVMSLILKPLVEWIESRLSLKRTTAIIVLYASVFLLLILTLGLILPLVIDQIVQFGKSLPDLAQKGINLIKTYSPALFDFIQPYIKDIDWTNFSGQTIQVTKGAMINSVPIFQRAGATLVKTISILSMAAIIPIYLFYFLDTKRDLIRDLKTHVPFGNDSVKEDVVFLVQEFLRLMVVFFRGQLVIGLIMGLLLALGFSIVGLEFGFVLGIMIGFLNIIPYLGTIIGLSIALPIAFFQPEGGFQTLLLSIGVFGIVQIIEGYLLTPKIMGKQTGLHPFILIFAILFWGTALEGIIGMILAIPLTAFLITAWELVKRKYLKQISVFE
jgi:predicted PurR-regulated permease PerM